jgi:hypothetical protein
MTWFKKQTKLTEQEQLVADIIKEMTERVDSVLEYDIEDASWLVTIPELEYYVSIDGVGVELSNHKFFVTRRMDDKVLSIMKKIVAEESSKRLKAKKQSIFKNELNLLEDVKNKIVSSSNDMPI